MRKVLFSLLYALCLPAATRGQTAESELAELFVSVEPQSIHYWFDEDADNKRTLNSLSGLQLINTASLSDGMHVLNCVLLGNDGMAYDVQTQTFVKTTGGDTSEDILTKGVAAKGLVYWFDDESDRRQSVDRLSGNYTIDVSSLENGMHTLHYYVVGEDGLPYGIRTSLFLNLDESIAQQGPNAVTMYKYWLNYDPSTIQTVSLDTPANPYTLLSLLPLQKMPIRSSSFHFQMDDGIPTVYAKNDLHIRFYDARGEFTDNFIEGHRSFIDYSISERVEPVGELQASQTFDRMANNEIRWYTVEAVKGDSLVFMAEKPCGLNLFSPSGREMYATSGIESTRWDGCHAEENGTYYLAVHDVASASGSVVTLHYQHIDRYAILRQNVQTVGNGGYTTITFEGNGFADLYAIDLINNEGDSIECVAIDMKDNATISPTFDFTNANIGVYDAVFHFAEGDVKMGQAITVVEATDIAINVELETPARLAGGSNPYFNVTIVCPNSGNNTAYDVPIEVSFSAPEGSITYINITNPEVPTLEQMFSNYEKTQEENDTIKQLSKNFGDIFDFIVQKWIDEVTGVMMEKHKIILSTTIAPEQSNTISFQIESNSDVKTEVDYPIDWIPIYNIKKKQYAPTPKICSGMEKLQCVLDWVATGTGAASTIIKHPIMGTIDCGASIIDSASGFIKDFVCGSPRETFNPLSFKTIRKTSPAWSFLISCFEGITGIKVHWFISGFSAGVTATNAVEQCENAFGNKKEGVSSFVRSADPNDIYGYMSPSGSKHIMPEQQNLFYTIAFENDPSTATAAAHDIYINDTLDATKFDLTTFAPTHITIGEKTADLTGEKNFVTTIDMRPEINVIAQVEGTFDEAKCIAKWHISSLDPMTMEPTSYVMDGVLPVNTNGQGTGELTYNISLKPGLAHAAEISNRAGIVFDNNDVIMTPTWTNVIDANAPESHIADVLLQNDSVATVSIAATDDLSGPWRYNVYVQYGSGAWFLAAENVPADTTATVKVYEGIDHGFYVVATDSAGNVERKQAMREMSLNLSTSVRGDVNQDGQVGIADIVAVTSCMAATNSNIQLASADVNGDGQVGIADIVAITGIMAANTGMSSRHDTQGKTYFVERKKQKRQ